MRGRALAEAYGDLVNAWEFENEPDIAFFADNADVFAAYHKAVALGLAAGRAAGEVGSSNLNGGLSHGAEPISAREYPRNPRLRFPAGRVVWDTVAPPAKSLVLMAAPGLPPGPHFEQLLANGYLSYTEGFNYHYYGFAMDYAGVYSQFKDAVAEAGAEQNGDGRLKTGAPSRRLPVFLTEWGYSLLDGYDAQNVEGRVRQWRYFADVVRQNEGLRVAAPMAFLLRPYFEIKAKEFGLSMPVDAARAKHYGWAQGAGSTEQGAGGTESSFLNHGVAREREDGRGRSLRPRNDRGAGEPLRAPVGQQGEQTHERHETEIKGAGSVGARVTEFRAGGLTFTPEDFGAQGVEPWMERIGERVGDAEASPALAWLLDRAASDGRRSGRDNLGFGRLGFGIWPRSGPRDWVVRTERPSPVVMDFVAGPDVRAVKSDHGYWLWGQVSAEEFSGVPMAREGAGVMVFYNFGSESAKVTPVWPAWIRPVEAAETNAGGASVLPREWDTLILAPGERREVAVVLRARADRLLPVDARITAEVRSAGVRTVSRWASRFYALPNGAVARSRDGFDFSEREAEVNRALLLARPHAQEEPVLRRDGRWLVTEGMRVEETDWGWRLHVDHFPGVALRPAVAELPLPEGWSLPTGAILSYDYRLIDGPGAKELSAASPDAKWRRQTGIAGNLAESYIRTATGNLFGTQPRLSPTADWKSYRQGAETLTMHFLGRTAPPWRFTEHKPAALVFFVRPVRLPAIFEVRNPRVIEIEAGW